MRKIQSQLSTTAIGTGALLALGGVALAGMAALPDGRGVASARVAEPTGLLVSRQDMSGRTAFYRQLRASAPAAGSAGASDGGDC